MAVGCAYFVAALGCSAEIGGPNSAAGERGGISGEGASPIGGRGGGGSSGGSGDGGAMGGSGSGGNGVTPPPPPFDGGPQVPIPGPPPNTANPAFMDQAALFACVPDEITYTPQRRWRLSGRQFIDTAHAFAATSQARLGDPFGFTPTGKLFNNYAEFFSIAESQLNGVLRGGRKAALRTLRDNKIPGCVRSAYRDAEFEEPADPFEQFDAGCQRGAINYGYQRLLGRAPTDDEVTRMQSKMVEIVELLGVRRGIPAALTLMFTLPDYLFRSEIGEVEPGGERARLTPYELGAALSLSLTSRTPWSARITDEIEDGSILEPATRSAVVDELLADRRFEDTLEAFLGEYFQYSKGSGIQKDGVSITTFNQALGRMRSMIAWLAARPDRFLEHLFTATETFEGSNPEPRGNNPQTPGILTRQAWLWSFSRNTENDPIHRGHFIREHILCQGIPSIPIDVIPQLPDPGPEDTLRDQLEIHSGSGDCWGCHQLMDPLGLVFEQFDHFGRYRTEEKGQPVDTSGAFYATRSMDGAIRDPVDMMQQLATSEEVEQCFIRHLFRFYMGRDETPGDACTLADAHAAYRSSNGSIKETVKSLMMSDTMLYRAVVDGE